MEPEPELQVTFHTGIDQQLPCRVLQDPGCKGVYRGLALQQSWFYSSGHLLQVTHPVTQPLTSPTTPTQKLCALVGPTNNNVERKKKGYGQEGQLFYWYSLQFVSVAPTGPGALYAMIPYYKSAAMQRRKMLHTVQSAK